MLDFEDPLFTKIGSAFITEVRTEDSSFQMQKASLISHKWAYTKGRQSQCWGGLGELGLW